MTLRIQRGALALASLALFSSLVLSAALAKPPTKKTVAKKPAAKKGASAALIAAGKTVYAANGCKNCHAIAGEGGMAGPDLTKVGADPKHTPEWLKVAIVSPTTHAPTSSMPAYDKLSDKDLKALIAYLGSLKK